MHTLQKIKGLTARDSVLLAQAFMLVGTIRVCLWFFPFRTVLRVLGKLARRRSTKSSDASYRQRVVWAVRAAARRLVDNKPCLTQALVVQLLFKRRGLPADLCIGVRKGNDGALRAHAWVVSDGEIVIGGKSSPFRYTVLSSPLDYAL